jgi:DedD protein
MDEKNELSDIVLNKGGSSNSNKKIILAIATLGVVLIVVIMLMNSINSKGTGNLPQAVLPPEPKTVTASENTLDKEPLFEDVPVVEEDTQESSNLNNIAKKLKKESAAVSVEEVNETPLKATVTEKKAVPQKTIKHETKVQRQVAVKHTSKPVTHKTTPTHAYFIQVGSFSKYQPNKKFLNSITNLGYHYSFKKVKNMNKVLVGPFATHAQANKAKAVLRSKVAPGAFLVKL